VADQLNVYAGVANAFMRPDKTGHVGIFRRGAASGDWQHVLSTVQAFTVFVHPKDPETVFAGTSDGVWRSTDRGATFQRTGFPDAQKEVWSFLVDSRDPKRVFAGASPIDVYRSDDNGATWRRLPTPAIPEHCKGPFASRVMRLAQHPKRPDEIYAALEINGVMRSTDAGETWTDCSAGLIELAGQPHLKSKIVSDTTAEGMLDGPRHHDQPGRSRRGDPCGPHGPVPQRRPGKDLERHGGRPLLAHNVWPRRQGLAARAQHALLRPLGRRFQPRRRRLPQPGWRPELEAF